MPIKPEFRHFYRGVAWKSVREAILARACHKCECRGQCGSARHGEFGPCGAPNRRLIVRPIDDPENWHGHHHTGNCIGAPCEDQYFFKAKVVWVILTIAHLNHVAGDDRPENLLALCQRCHLRMDSAQHAASAARTRAAKSAQRGLL